MGLLVGLTEEQFGWRVEATCPQALRVLISQDLHSLREARQQILKHSSNNTGMITPITHSQQLFDAMATQDITLREIAAIYRCDVSLIISSAEMELLQKYFGVPASILCHCPFLLEAPDEEKWRSFADRKHFVSLGTFMHAPNRDAVLYLKQTLWPLIRQQLPDAQLFVYGSYAAAKDNALHNAREGFNVCGWAEDALHVMSAARACLAPLRFGAGIKGKLAEAMLCGTPSVTTSIGAEGMCDGMAWAGAIADYAQAFADAAVSLHETPALWLRAQQHGSAILHTHFNKAVISPRFIGHVQNIAAQLDAHRRANFTGSMLRHHLHKSTHYMSRWIEAKNQLSKTPIN